MGIEWQPGPDMEQLRFGYKLWKWTFLGAPLVAGAVWLVWYIAKQV